MPNAEELLSCALTYRDADLRESSLNDRFKDEESAVSTFTQVLLHEAKESMMASITVPEHPYLHPVDVDTDEPGIVDKKEEFHVWRGRADMPRVQYRRQRTQDVPRGAVEPTVLPPPIDMSLEKAREEAKKALQRTLLREEKKAETARRNELKQEDRKRERDNETEDARRERLEEAKRKRTERKQRKEEAAKEGVQEDSLPLPPSEKTPPLPLPLSSEDALLVPDLSAIPKPPLRKRGVKATFFETPVPHHRHLYGLQRCGLSNKIAAAVLRGESCDDVVLLQGPPGTGKTTELVSRIPGELRVFLCAPTNVGVVNLYLKCVERFPNETSLVLPPERIPVGTPVTSNDPTRRIVCSTLSARGGRMLDGQVFDHVYLDEAGQCMEAWAWTLLRPDVVSLTMAGDVKQLPATVSRSGKDLGHDRSLMERLVRCGYPYTVLKQQNRMAPELLALTNKYYGNILSCGPHAPKTGNVTWVEVVEGREAARDTSFINEEEANQVANVVSGCDTDSTVVLAPYAAQCRLLLSKRMGVHVHTVDSYQGREKDTVVLSVVRTGEHGVGFWEDERRIVVALTRAKRSLVIIHSPAMRDHLLRAAAADC